MNSLFKFFLSNKQDLICQKHKQCVTKLCCNSNCTNEKKHFICNHAQCIEAHRTHTQISFQTYKQLVSYIEKEIEFKKQIKVSLTAYKQEILKTITTIFQQFEKTIDEYLDKRCSSKYLLEIEKKFKYQEHFQDNKKIEFYLPFLKYFPKIQAINTRKFVVEDIIKKIKQSEKKCLKNFNFEFIGLDESIFPDEEIKEIRQYSKQEKLKKILPFKCQLNLKFRASQHNFLSNKLYSTDIRGPIILIVHSHKNRIFGGYSPVMFPKTEEYIEDNKLECFLFSLDDKCLLPIKEQYRQYSIRGGKNFWFGRGDLAISDECQKGNISWAQIGRAYKAPALAYGNESYWLSGAWYYRVLQYEIFEVDFDSIK